MLTDFIKATGLSPERTLCVSNACSSALAALALAQHWLNQGLTDVLILSADAVTPFVSKGFKSLNVLSATRPQPFGANRSGFFLGEAAACLVLSAAGQNDSVFLHPVGLDTEGTVVTRPDSSATSLVRAAKAIGFELKPDVILAHGTATQINDQTEDIAFQQLFPEDSPPITGAKWCTGHTLGTSAALDTLLACEILRRGSAFGLKTTEFCDRSLRGNYQLATFTQNFRRVLISSLGFGGMHAMAQVELLR